jgi:1-acyl-sn-glycerol-3-phosphate acyltransferase
MIKRILGTLNAVVSIIALACNTLFWTIPILSVAFFKLIGPIPSWRSLCVKTMNLFASGWVGLNNQAIRLTQRVKWDVKGLESLKLNSWYLVISNHQSWLDIVVLQKVFNRRIPFLKFFVKKELIWVPVLGLIWWAMEFPFMKRYSRSFIEKHPHLKDIDLKTGIKACENFKETPVSIMIFAEGSRFSPVKAKRQGSPFSNLLKPKAAGMAIVLGAMGERLERILNVTIVYPNGRKGLWDFLCRRISEIKVRVEQLPVPTELLGDYLHDHDFRQNFQNWVNKIWAEKDRYLQTMAMAS